MKHIFMMNDTKKYHDFEVIIHDVMNTYDYDIIYTTSMKASIQYIQQYPQKARFYAVGGDGTIHGIIQALVNTDHECVVIPLGTGNDFCRMLTKEKNPRKVLEESLHYQTQKIDTIQLNETYYINSACFGLDSVIANHVHDTPQIPFVPESKSYIVSIFQNILSYTYENIIVISQGQCLFKGKAILCTLNNGQFYGGGFKIIPHADIQDGLMDICIVDKLPMKKIPYMLSLLLREKLYDRKEVHYFQVNEAKVIFSKSCNLDGEEEKHDEYNFKVCPQSLNMVIFK